MTDLQVVQQAAPDTETSAEQDGRGRIKMNRRLHCLVSDESHDPCPAAADPDDQFSFALVSEGVETEDGACIVRQACIVSRSAAGAWRRLQGQQ